MKMSDLGKPRLEAWNSDEVSGQREPAAREDTAAAVARLRSDPDRHMTDAHAQQMRYATILPLVSKRPPAVYGDYNYTIHPVLHPETRSPWIAYVGAAQHPARTCPSMMVSMH